MKILNFGYFVFQMVARWIFEIFNRDKCLFCFSNTTLAASTWSRTGTFYYFSCNNPTISKHCLAALSLKVLSKYGWKGERKKNYSVTVTIITAVIKRSAWVVNIYSIPTS